MFPLLRQIGFLLDLLLMENLLNIAKVDIGRIGQAYNNHLTDFADRKGKSHMTKRLTHILNRIDSRHLSKLWSFYRDYFTDDDSCLNFLYGSFLNEPVTDGIILHESDEANSSFINSEGTIIFDSDFIPRRMLNAVERLVSAARDMEQIRRGKDIFKIVFIVTCVETLQKLCGTTGTKKELLFNFFEDFTNEDDKKFITDHFTHDDEEFASPEGDSFKQFIGVLNEYRNCATHEGEYWDVCFDNNRDEGPLLLVLNIDLENFSSLNKKEHSFHTSIRYKDFEAIFIRTCINFISQYTALNADA